LNFSSISSHGPLVVYSLIGREAEELI